MLLNIILIILLIGLIAVFALLIRVVLQNRDLRSDKHFLIVVNSDLIAQTVAQSESLNAAEEECETKSRERDDAWSILEMILLQDLENNYGASNVAVEVSRGGVQYVFHYNDQAPDRIETGSNS